jgi:deoxyhypusine synthase
MTDRGQPGKPVRPPEITAEKSVADLIDETFTGFNAGRLREACELFCEKFCLDDTLVGVTVSGALTPAGLGRSCLVPLIKMGCIDWMVATGANLYHDLHFAMGLDLYRGSPFADDRELRRMRIVRIYDVVFPEKVLFETDAYLTRLFRGLSLEGAVGTARIHHEIGLRLLKDFPERADFSILATAARHKVPVYTPAPGDSTIGMTLASLAAKETRITVDPSIDVNETSALVYRAHQHMGASAVMMIGGGTPKNFALQTEPYLQEISHVESKGHDYSIQFTDARPDTGGLSGATPSEAVSWGKVNAENLRHTVVCYADATICLPLLVSYACHRNVSRKHRRAYDFRKEALAELVRDMKLAY